MITFNDVCKKLGLDPKEVREVIKGEYKITISGIEQTQEPERKGCCKNGDEVCYCYECLKERNPLLKEPEYEEWCEFCQTDHLRFKHINPFGEKPAKKECKHEHGFYHGYCVDKCGTHEWETKKKDDLADVLKKILEDRLWPTQFVPKVYEILADEARKYFKEKWGL